jgi:hypothetical protein
MFSAAFLDIFLNAAAMLLTTGFAWLRCVPARPNGIRHAKAMLRPLHLSKRVPWVLPLLGQQIRRHPLSGDSSVNLFVRDSLRQSGARFCYLHSQRPPIRA